MATLLLCASFLLACSWQRHWPLKRSLTPLVRRTSRVLASSCFLLAVIVATQQSQVAFASLQLVLLAMLVGVVTAMALAVVDIRRGRPSTVNARPQR